MGVREREKEKQIDANAFFTTTNIRRLYYL